MGLNITKGEWLISGNEVVSKKGYKDASFVCQFYIEPENKWFNPIIHPYHFENAELIIDAGNTYQECGLTPRQLLEQRDELLASLEEAVFDMVQMTRCINGLISSLGGDEDYDGYSDEIERYKSVISKIKGVSNDQQ